jgi:murein DD-endopeptidase MepM/ murein hydrolase activator NlpD
MSVLEQSGSKIPAKNVDKFIQVNQEMRAKNVKKLSDVMLEKMDVSKIDNFSIKPFTRLRGSKTVAGFAERRHYYYNDEKIDEAWHLGIDWASVKKAPIKVSNGGKVIFNEYLGIYGNSVIIDHGMGLATLYSHTSSTAVEVGDEVAPRQKIANTGMTGAVFGDHLHFGVLVQGIEVNPIEWMDRNWIKTRITDIIKEAKKLIDSK